MALEMRTPKGGTRGGYQASNGSEHCAVMYNARCRRTLEIDKGKERERSVKSELVEKLMISKEANGPWARCQYLYNHATCRAGSGEPNFMGLP
jgi:hypothetical protein